MKSHLILKKSFFISLIISVALLFLLFFMEILWFNFSYVVKHLGDSFLDISPFVLFLWPACFLMLFFFSQIKRIKKKDRLNKKSFIYGGVISSSITFLSLIIIFLLMILFPDPQSGLIFIILPIYLLIFFITTFLIFSFFSYIYFIIRRFHKK